MFQNIKINFENIFFKKQLTNFQIVIKKYINKLFPNFKIWKQNYN